MNKEELKTEELVELTTEQKLEEGNDKYLRLLADFDNYKKRTQREKEDIVLTTKTKMLSTILDIDSDISIAIKSMDEISEGILLIVKKLDTFLKNQNIEVIQTETYDEDLHEVVSVIDVGESKVIDVITKGYTIDGKVIRYPKIILGK